MSGLSEALYNSAPMAGAIMRLPISTTVTRFVIPASFAGRRCKWKALGADGDIAFGDVTVTVTLDTASSVDGSGNITLNAATGKKLKDGIEDHWVMPTADQAGYFSVDGSASGGLEVTIEG